MKKVLFLFIAIVTLVSCEKFNVRKTPADTVSGSAQKGYLVKGSKVTAIAYGPDMKPTGMTFPATINGSLGAFSINVKDANASYFELKAEGCYFDEITGDITESPICLEAFVSSYESKANLNLFTTITKGRIMKLVSEGMSYEKAKAQAQVEFLKTVNLAGADIDFTKFDLTGGSDADAMFLLTTCAIQNERSANELTAILQKAESEFKENGTFSEKTAKELFRPGQELDMSVVFENLSKYYEENGLSKDDLPSYWKYFYLGENETMKIISVKGLESSDPESESSDAFSGTIKLVSIEPFTVSADVDWVTFEKRELEKELFEIKVDIAENKTYKRREGYIIFSNLESKVLKRVHFSQGQAFPNVDPKKSLKGKGMPGDSFLIECLDDLLYMRDVFNSTGDRLILSRTDSVSRPARDAYFELVSDIDLSPVCGQDKGDWTPIGKFQDGDYNYEHSGFDGNFNSWKKDSDGLSIIGHPGYKISGLYIKNNQCYQGLFGVINGGSVTGLVVEGNVSGGNYVGLLAGFGVRVFNDSDGYYHGGANDIETRGRVFGDNYVGGILGRCEFGIGTCVNYADVESMGSCGGISSILDNARINRCRNYGEISSLSPYHGNAGGIAAYAKHLNVYDCGNFGNVSGPGEIGGIFGHAYSIEVTWGNKDSYCILNSFNTGDICLVLNNPQYHYSNYRSAGGIVGCVDGSFLSVKNCYSSGTVSFEEGIDNEYIGGICGQLRKNKAHRIEQNYWLQEGIPATGGEIANESDTYGENVVQNCFRLTQAQMKGQKPYEGVLYKSTGGKSINTFLESLNTFLEDNKNNLPSLHFWEYSSTEPFPVHSQTSTK